MCRSLTTACLEKTQSHRRWNGGTRLSATYRWAHSLFYQLCSPFSPGTDGVVGFLRASLATDRGRSADHCQHVVPHLSRLQVSDGQPRSWVGSRDVFEVGSASRYPFQLSRKVGCVGSRVIARSAISYPNLSHR